MSRIDKYSKTIQEIMPRTMLPQLKAISEEKNFCILLYLLSEKETYPYKVSSELGLSRRETERRLNRLKRLGLVETYLTGEHSTGEHSIGSEYAQEPVTELNYQPTLSSKQLIFGLLEFQYLTEEDIEERLEKFSKLSK